MYCKKTHQFLTICKSRTSKQHKSVCCVRGGAHFYGFALTSELIMHIALVLCTAVQNFVSIGSAVFAQLTVVTDTHTHTHTQTATLRVTASVGIAGISCFDAG